MRFLWKIRREDNWSLCAAPGYGGAVIGNSEIEGMMWECVAEAERRSRTRNPWCRKDHL